MMIKKDREEDDRDGWMDVRIRKLTNKQTEQRNIKTPKRRDKNQIEVTEGPKIIALKS